MILVADEGVDQPVVVQLRRDGHQVTAIVELSPSLADDEVLRIAIERKALLLTQDRDFGELVFRLRRASHGVLLIRLHGVPAAEKALRVSAALKAHGSQMTDHFSVLDRQALRIRGLTPP